MNHHIKLYQTYFITTNISDLYTFIDNMFKKAFTQVKKYRNRYDSSPGAVISLPLF